MTNNNKTSKRANMGVVIACTGLVAGMAGLSFAAVPLYKIFCQVTGYGGTTQRAELTSDIQVIDRTITIRFDGNISKELHWEFKPAQRDVTVKMGESVEIKYTAENLSDQPMSGMATFNVTPQSAGAYFNKIECFCFTETTLQPGEKIDMPVVFFIDPDLDQEKHLKHLKTITLSYTFFKEDDPQTPVASVEIPSDKTSLN